MEDFQKWVCVYEAKSLLEANSLRAILENKGISVNMYSLPLSRLHDFLHDKHQRVRVFIQEADYARAKCCTEELFLKSDRQTEDFA